MAERRTRRRFTAESKVQAVKQLLDGRSLSKVATELGLNTSQRGLPILGVMAVTLERIALGFERERGCDVVAIFPGMEAIDGAALFVAARNHRRVCSHSSRFSARIG